MKILVVGMGAAAAVLVRALEKTKGNDVIYLGRAGRRAATPRVKVVDERTGELHVRERPAILEPGDPLPRVDQVLVAVRDEQLDGALDALDALPGEPPCATVTQGAADLDRLRARLGGARPVVQLTPTFQARREGDVIRFRRPPLVPMAVWHGADLASTEFAAVCAAQLVAGGLPARSLPTSGLLGGLRRAAPELARRLSRL